MRAEVHRDVYPRHRLRLFHITNLIQGPVDRTCKGKATAGKPQTSGCRVSCTSFAFSRQGMFGFPWLIPGRMCRTCMFRHRDRIAWCFACHTSHYLGGQTTINTQKYKYFSILFYADNMALHGIYHNLGVFSGSKGILRLFLLACPRCRSGRSINHPLPYSGLR
jgi:hypothetical protein